MQKSDQPEGRVVELVVSCEWVMEHRADVQLADVRWYLDGRSARAAFEEGHAPGATFIDLDRWLAGPPDTASGRHPLPDPQIFATGMSESGLDSDRPVVAYDDEGGVIAARLVWMLRMLGQPVALLNGGLSTFGSPLERGWRPPSPRPFAHRPWPARYLATLDDVIDVSNSASPSTALIDARDATRYRGESEPVDPRAGHIPGALNVPCRQNLAKDGMLLSQGELRERFERAGVTEATCVISYCGSGITACHNLVTMEWSGLGIGRLFPGSWSQYSHQPTLPLAVGDTPR